ncbi:hypothetical protein [Nostoc sp. WHI]|uniref:hypothetical protein n=1 Tax=Nostoc sp. WHI TaxID=2650611 RepID=UPI0018C6167D|nr:hypothetical protein [Nostoc sp. WHI]MBG1265640.1 hypothetical protein [Nostoc sp. WHI]
MQIRCVLAYQKRSLSPVGDTYGGLRLRTKTRITLAEDTCYSHPNRGIKAVFCLSRHRFLTLGYRKEDN